MTDEAAGTTIARESPEAAGLLVAVMQHNANAAAALNARLLTHAKRERDQWRERALAAEAKVARIEARLLDLIHGA